MTTQKKGFITFVTEVVTFHHAGSGSGIINDGTIIKRPVQSLQLRIFGLKIKHDNYLQNNIYIIIMHAD